MRNNTRRLIIIVSFVIVLLIAGQFLGGKSLILIPVDSLRRIGTSGYGTGYGALLLSRSGQLENHENSRSAPVWAPGTYMAGRRPSTADKTGPNDKKDFACKWRYGLPIYLAYPPSGVTGSPQARKNGPYRILPHIIRGANHYINNNHTILANLTLCTHATADQVYNIVEIVRRWEGPVSLAIFAPGLDAGLAVALLERACRCEPQMSKVSVHLVFPAGRPPSLGPLNRVGDETPGDCAASDLQLRESDTERKQRGMIYPINVGRNVARNFSLTSRVLVSDIELLPSEKLATGFLRMINSGRSTKNGSASSENMPPARPGIIFVLPTFEVMSRIDAPPSNKHELMAAIRNGIAVYFHRFVCVHCQRFPGITRWLLRPDPGRVRALIVTRREYPYHRWEPVFIGTKNDPWYDEEMSWEGRQDKMAQMLEMCLMNYRMIILDGAFLVHSPGIKHKASRIETINETVEGPDRAQEKRNARLYQRETRRLLKQYPINRKCRQ